MARVVVNLSYCATKRNREVNKLMIINLDVKRLWALAHFDPSADYIAQGKNIRLSEEGFKAI